MSDFQEFQKIARLRRGCVVTEKIDGTNAQAHITLPTADVDDAKVIARQAGGFVMLAGSRNRYITPDDDNFGFASWVLANAAELWALGEGRHFGEWWGSGIQRRYGLEEKRFSLFDVHRWVVSGAESVPMLDPRFLKAVLPACCSLVPVLYEGPFADAAIEDVIARLALDGSVAAPGFMKPEGVVVYHVAARQLFKRTIEKDGEPKGKTAAA